MGSRTLIQTFVGVSLTASTAAYVHAQIQPVLPSNPVSERECADFKKSSKAYLAALRDQYHRCSRANFNVPVSQWRPSFGCSFQKTRQNVNVPPACIPAANAWDCATSEIGRMINQCLDLARQHQYITAKDEADKLNQSLRKALLDTEAGMPNVAQGATKRLARWWSEQTNNATVSSLLKAAEVAGYGRLANGISSIFDATNDSVTRAEQLALLFNTNGDMISRDMTAMAVRDVAQTGREAVNMLIGDLSDFGREIDFAVSEAKAREAEAKASETAEAKGKQASKWQCFPDYASCTSYCRQVTGASGNSGWCGGICSEGGDAGSLPKPREFGNQRCFHPPQ